MMFCPYCGSKVQPSMEASESIGQEQVEGAIPLAVRKDGDEEGRIFTLVITGSLIIFARTTEEDLSRIGKASETILMGGAILDPERHRKTLGSYSRRYLSMEPTSVVEESAENIYMKTADVTAIRISSEEDAEGDQFYLLAFETKAGPRKYLIPSDKDSRDLLISTFGQKVHW